MSLIGLVGYKGSGKSVVAATLEEQGFVRSPMAGPMKDFMVKYAGLSEEQVYGDLKEVVDPRFGLTPRFIMQQFGTEVVRSIHPDWWVKLKEVLLNTWAGSVSVVIEDVGFENEVDLVRSRGGIIVRVVRSGLVINDTHASEQLDCVADHLIINDGTLVDLKREALKLVGLKN